MSEAYRRRSLEIRRAGLALTRVEQSRLTELLSEYADEVSELVRRFGRVSDRVLLRELRVLINELTADLFAINRQHIDLQIRTLSEMHARSHALALAAQAVLADDFAARMSSVAVELTASVIRRERLVSAIAGIRTDAVREAQRVLREEAVRGGNLAAIEKRLRVLVRGSEEIPANLLLDRRRIGKRALTEFMGYDEPTARDVENVRRTARQVSSRARLIARTEMANAERDVEAAAMRESPIVKGGLWFLSQRHTGRDSCDVLAESDLYGMGAGVYPADAIPDRPHPRCLCGLRHVLRPVSEWGTPQATGRPLVANPRRAALRAGLPPSGVAAVVGALIAAEQRRAAA